ncbi:MAG TPA: GntR family transcriptional regulator [Thermomicrobiales bacterium]|jgi:DNA-binding GntR family transcriptional regulator
MTLQTAPPIGRRVLREHVKEYLIDAIVRGDVKPGERIVETQVAQQLGVSQGPVREALRDLEIFGFVVSSPFRGTQVRQISSDDLVDIYPIRAALEGIAARAAASRIDESMLARLEMYLDQMREAAAKDDRETHIDADVAFHRTVIEASGNRLLRQFWDSMHLATTTFVTNAMARRSLHELAERHAPLLAALRAHDPVAAEDAMRRHIEEPGEWVLAAAQAASHQGPGGDGATSDGKAREDGDQ